MPNLLFTKGILDKIEKDGLSGRASKELRKELEKINLHITQEPLKKQKRQRKKQRDHFRDSSK